MQKLMTNEEIHDFGIETVANYIEKEGHEIQTINTEIGMNPQIVAKKNGELEFIFVRTDCYPSKGQIKNERTALAYIAHADKFKATCYFASVGICNSEGKNNKEMAIPIKGAGFYVSFTGLELLTRSDRIRVVGKSKSKP